MFSFAKKEMTPKFNINRLKQKIDENTIKFDNKLIEIQHFAIKLNDKAEKNKNYLNRLKKVFHSIDILIADKDKNLKMIFANSALCSRVYGLPDACSDLIEGRHEYDIINDYIEKTGNWNSFIECMNYNIDKIVLEYMTPQKFLQIGFVGNKKIILKTNSIPYTDDDIFGGIVSISNIISENQLEIEMQNAKLLYNKNNYTAYLL